MPKAHNPRHGSMQVWPRVRAKRSYARVRSWPESKDAKPLGFAGYKVGMTHVIYPDTKKTSLTKGENVSVPVTVIECPPLKVAGAVFYKMGPTGLRAKATVMGKVDKELSRKLKLQKKADEKKLDSLNHSDYTDIKLLVYTQPKLTGIGRKKPEIFEVGLGGSVEEKFNYVKENLGKELSIKDVFAEGQQLDFHGITKGKGFQGPVKRFGVTIRARKSEKTKRGPGSLGGWIAQAHTMYRIAHAGQMGYHQRTEYNKVLMKIGENGDEVNPEGGFLRYGLVKNNYILVRGSVSGPSNRIIRFNTAIRPHKRNEGPVPAITYISKNSKQGR